jgi:hypothetical protein
MKGEERPSASRVAGYEGAEPRWQMIYGHLLHVEQHWTTQLQNQQQRNATLISVNGVLLGFLGFGGLTQVLGAWVFWSQVLFVTGLGLLALALAFGVSALVPSVPVDANDWLDPTFVLELASSSTNEAAYQRLAEAVAGGLTSDPPEHDVPHLSVLRRRRRWMKFQIEALAAALIPLAGSIGLQLSRGH